MKNKKAAVIIIAVAAFITAAILLLFIPRDITIVTSTSSFIFSSNSIYDTNPLLKIKLPSFRYKKEELKSIKKELQKPYEEALETVIQNDPYAFHDDYSSAEGLVCEIGDLIYYFRVNDTANVYKFNKTSGEITSCPLSGYNSFSSIESKAKYETVDHNFTAFVCITTEALIDSYPELRAAIDGTKGNFYCDSIYYVNGRIFFENNCILYEFIPAAGKAIKTASIGRENIEFITTRN